MKNLEYIVLLNYEKLRFKYKNLKNLFQIFIQFWYGSNQISIYYINPQNIFFLFKEILNLQIILLLKQFLQKDNVLQEYQQQQMDKKSSPAYTMSSRLKQTINKISPGPMSYRENLQIIKPSGPRASIGKAPRMVFKQADGPAPGQYDLQKQKLVRPKSSCAVFPKYQEPSKKEIDKKIGPGSYQPDYEKVFRKSLSSSKFSRTQKFFSKDDISKIAPGPMTYNPKVEFILNNSGAVKFGNSSRIDETKLKASIPGPGKYVSEKADVLPSQPSYKFPNQKRQTVKIQKDIPGPLDYKIEGQIQSNLKHKKGFKIGTDSKQINRKADTPAPNAYNSQKKICLKRAPAFSISHTDRKNTFYQQASTPGPNKYNPSFQPKKRVGSALITSSKRQLQIQLLKKKTIPGPGAYEKVYQYNTIGSGIKFSIPKSKVEKQREIKTQRMPGPWSYNTIDSLKQSLKYGVMGKSQRQYFEKKGIPGPGQYTIKDQRKPGVVIGRQKRSKQKPSNIPGPNSYMIPSTIGSLPYYQKSVKK